MCSLIYLIVDMWISDVQVNRWAKDSYCWVIWVLVHPREERGVSVLQDTAQNTIRKLHHTRRCKLKGVKSLISSRSYGWSQPKKDSAIQFIIFMIHWLVSTTDTRCMCSPFLQYAYIFYNNARAHIHSHVHAHKHTHMLTQIYYIYIQYTIQYNG